MREGSSSKGQQRGLCFSCGQSCHLRSECCFRNAECYKCGKVGHLQKACHSSDRGKFNRSNSFHKKAPKKTVHCLEEVADKGRWKPVIVANRPENGGTVPNFTPLSRYCPEIYKAKPQKFN